jgi:hypothetical protein
MQVPIPISQTCSLSPLGKFRHISWFYSIFKQILRWYQVRNYAFYAVLPKPVHHTKPLSAARGDKTNISWWNFSFSGLKKLWSQTKINSINSCLFLSSQFLLGVTIVISRPECKKNAYAMSFETNYRSTPFQTSVHREKKIPRPLPKATKLFSLVWPDKYHQYIKLLECVKRLSWSSLREYYVIQACRHECRFIDKFVRILTWQFNIFNNIVLHLMLIMQGTEMYH